MTWDFNPSFPKQTHYAFIAKELQLRNPGLEPHDLGLQPLISQANPLRLYSKRLQLGNPGLEPHDFGLQASFPKQTH